MSSSLGQPHPRTFAAARTGAHLLTNGQWALPPGHGVLIDSYTPADRFATGGARRPARRSAARAARRVGHRLVA